MNEDQILGRIAVVEYILSQAFALTLIHFDGSDDVLKDCEEHFTHSFQASTLNENQKRFALEASSRFYSSVRASILAGSEVIH